MNATETIIYNKILEREPIDIEQLKNIMFNMYGIKHSEVEEYIMKSYMIVFLKSLVMSRPYYMKHYG